MRFLFRLQDTDVFITTEDPNVRYDILCGHCSYPVAADDEQCPRCQRMLEDCPVCSGIRKRKSLRAVATSDGEKTCSVCHTRRLPFGAKALDTVRGSFCTNLYGCPAGGLLLRTEEVALLPEDATLCPICRHASLLPRDVLTFRHLVQRCLFCGTCLGQLPAWPADTASPHSDLLQVDELKPPGEPNTEPCVLCGRDDRLEAAERPQVKVQAETVPAAVYQRMVQLGRALALETNDREAFRLTFGAWHDPIPGEAAEDPVAVQRLVSLLLQGTLRDDVHTILKQRLDTYNSSWAHKVPEGINYHFRASALPGRRRRPA
jgi:hypothetical protein